MATTIKSRKRTIPARCLAPGNEGISRMADFSGRRGVFDDDSLTRTRLASQEEQATCFQLIEEGWEKTSFGFVQRGQAIVIMDENSSP